MVDASGAELKRLLIDRFAEIGDAGTNGSSYINRDGWWRDASILRLLPSALAADFRGERPTVVLGPQSSGYILGPMVARELGVGFVGAQKEITLLADSDVWLRATTPPDYRDRHVEFGFRRGSITAADRVLVVDDWVETGSQLLALHSLVRLAEARVIGTVVVADNLSDNRVRRELRLSSLIHARDIWK